MALSHTAADALAAAGEGSAGRHNAGQHSGLGLHGSERATRAERRSHRQRGAESTGEALLKAIDVELAGEAGPAAEADPGGAAGAGDDRPTTAFAAERRRTGARGGRLQRRPGTRPHLRPGFWRGKARAGGFNASDYQLTRELIAAVAGKDKLVLVTFANHHFGDFARNWVSHVRALGLANYLVGAMDDRLLQELAEDGVNVFAMRSDVSLDDAGWGSPTFHKMGREKIALIELFTVMGFDILITDVDVVWLKDPLPYIARFPDADILTSSDHLANTTDGDGLERWPVAASAANIGIMLFRVAARKLAEEWNRVLDADEKIWDQNAFNDIFRRVTREDDTRSDGLFWVYDGTLRMGILPVALFAGGHTFFAQRMAERMGLDPYAVHATFQFSGTPGKRHRLRERMVWDADPPEYYDPPGGLMAFRMDYGGLVNSSAPPRDDMELQSFMRHFRLVNHQLVQIRQALAIAGALGRALIIPELWCGADRYWAPHGGVIPGAALRLPFQCPTDHVLDLEQMIRKLPEDEFGPNVAYREYSLLDNPRAKAARGDLLNITACKAGSKGCNGGGAPARQAKGNVVRLEANLTDAQLRAVLEPFRRRKVLAFDDVRAAFGAFADPADAARFETRTKIYASIWCCVNKHPGHVWYDLWWDKVPRVDRHNRSITGPWAPIMGP